MEFARLAHTFEELEGTSSRLTLIELLTQLFRSIERPEEIEQVCYLVQGRVAPFYVALEMGMAEKSVTRSLALAYHTTPEHVEALYATLGDLGLVAAQVSSEAGSVPTMLSVDEVFGGLRAIAQTSGKGAIEHKSARLVDLLTRVDSMSTKYVVRILLGNLRLGVGSATVLDALAKARWNDVKKRKLLEGAYNKTSDLGLIGRIIFAHLDEEEAERAVAALDIQVGKPIHSQLAERLPSVEAIIAKMGTVVAQYKYDGLRAQIHKDGGRVTIFSRNLEDQSHMFPELIAGTLKQVRGERAILDAETLAYNATSEEFLPFQETTRRRRKHGIEAMAEQIPLKAFVFDILYKDGVSLLDTPLAERLKVLEETLHPAEDTLMLTASHTMEDAHALTLLFDEAISKGLEGLVVKKLESRYEAGARNFNWVKLKRHSAGDRAVRNVLDAYEQVVNTNPGLKTGTLAIEHAFLADATQQARAGRLGVSITVQQPLLYEQGAALLAGWGKERTSQILPIRGWLEAGAQVSAGTDSPPTSFDPMQAVWGMVTRGTKQIGVQGPEYAIDQYTAMQLYTAASAQLNWESERRGTIQPRRLADLMAYRTDPITCPVDQLLGLRPVFTMVGGRAVYDPESMFSKQG